MSDSADVVSHKTLLKRFESKHHSRNRKRAKCKHNRIATHLNRKIRILHKKITNIVDHAHYQVAKDMIRSASTILISSADVKQWIKKLGRKFSKAKANFIQRMSLSKFTDRLTGRLILASVRNPSLNFDLRDVPDPYSTRTCVCCGTDNDIGVSKIYVCKNPNCILSYLFNQRDYGSCGVVVASVSKCVDQEYMHVDIGCCEEILRNGTVCNLVANVANKCVIHDSLHKSSVNCCYPECPKIANWLLKVCEEHQIYVSAWEEFNWQELSRIREEYKPAHEYPPAVTHHPVVAPAISIQKSVSGQHC